MVVRVFSLDTAKPIDLHYSTGQGAGQLSVQLGAGRTINDVSLRAVGSRLYIIGGTIGISSYDLDHPGNCWVPGPGTLAPNVAVSNAFVGKNHILLLTEPEDAQQAMMFNRQQNGFAPQPRILLNHNRVIPPQEGAGNQAAGPSMGIYAFARYPQRPRRR